MLAGVGCPMRPRRCVCVCRVRKNQPIYTTKSSESFCQPSPFFIFVIIEISCLHLGPLFDHDLFVLYYYYMREFGGQRNYLIDAEWKWWYIQFIYSVYLAGWAFWASWNCDASNMNAFTYVDLYINRVTSTIEWSYADVKEFGNFQHSYFGIGLNGKKRYLNEFRFGNDLSYSHRTIGNRGKSIFIFILW